MATQNPYSNSLLIDAVRGSLSNAESLGRGFAVAPVGLLGDINSLARQYITPRLPQGVQSLLQSAPAAPTTEQILSNIPRVSNQRMETAGMEQLGAAMNPRGPVDLARGVGRVAGNAINEAMVYDRGLLAGITPQPMRMDVYHGSPHGPFTKFDPTKARTGEGNASYGEGAYLAQARKTGEDYRNRLSDWGSPHTYEYQGQIYAPSSERVDDPVRHAVQLTYHQGKKVAQDIAKMGLRDAQKGEAYALEMGGVPYYEQMLNTAKGINKKDIKATQGFLYKVDLPDEAIPKMIDWDKPLGKQSKEVQQAIEKTKSMLPPNAIEDLGGDLSLLYGKDVTPEQFLNTWESFGQKAGGETALAEQGVTGVRYLDQGSRKSKSGTSNFVVFPKYQDLLTIKEINDRPIQGLLNPTKPSFTYPQQSALDLAQQRAALPVEQGGLGLLSNNTATERAKAMGFNIESLHGTSNPSIEKFDPSMVGTKAGNAFDNYMWSTTSPDAATGYSLNMKSYEALPEVVNLKEQKNNILKQISNAFEAKDSEKVGELRKQLNSIHEKELTISDAFKQGQILSEGSTVYPLALQRQEFMPYEAGGKNWMRANRPAIEQSQDLGYQGVQINNVIDNPNSFMGNVPATTFATENPDLLRSRFAAFDPFRKTAATAAAMGVAAPDLLAQEQPVITQQQIDDEMAKYGLLGR